MDEYDEYFDDDFDEDYTKKIDEFENRIYIDSKIQKIPSVKNWSLHDKLDDDKLFLDEKIFEEPKIEEKKTPTIPAPWANIRSPSISFKEEMLKQEKELKNTPTPPSISSIKNRKFSIDSIRIAPSPSISFGDGIRSIPKISILDGMIPDISTQKVLQPIDSNIVKKRFCKIILEGKKCHNKCIFAHNINELNPQNCQYTICRNLNCYYIHKNESIIEYCKRLNIKIPETDDCKSAPKNDNTDNDPDKDNNRENKQTKQNKNNRLESSKKNTTNTNKKNKNNKETENNEDEGLISSVNEDQTLVKEVKLLISRVSEDEKLVKEIKRLISRVSEDVDEISTKRLIPRVSKDVDEISTKRLIHRVSEDVSEDVDEISTKRLIPRVSEDVDEISTKRLIPRVSEDVDEISVSEVVKRPYLSEDKISVKEVDGVSKDIYIEKIFDFSDNEIIKLVNKKDEKRNESYSKLTDKNYVLNHLKKTKFCQFIIKSGRCRRDNCNFAHKLSEFTFPSCVFKDKCLKKDCSFLHPDESLEKYKERINFVVPENII